MKKWMSKARVLDRADEVYVRLAGRHWNHFRPGIYSRQVVALANAICEEVDRVLNELLARRAVRTSVGRGGSKPRRRR